MRIKLVVGLGNPGKEYEKTRHNMGFRVLDKVAEKLNISNWKQRDGALYFDTYVGFSKVLFLKPQEYINLSGDVMIKFVKFFDIDIDDIFIVSDDLDIPIGTIKLKEKGSSGGHNGLKNIEKNLKTQNFKRIKIGISNDKTKDTKDYVLSKFSKEEELELKKVIDTASDAVLGSLEHPFTDMMNKYNTRVKQS
ncbi:MAG: aminoacyl-tRNA hydrolase [Tenericutes bacterium]|nr:aminoacyl-tRNA hydrolase [Mycoplasmatota bacterium]